jgi:hypothetical protein
MISNAQSKSLAALTHKQPDAAKHMLFLPQGFDHLHNIIITPKSQLTYRDIAT